MKDELEKKLRDKYSSLFPANLHLEIGDGWYNVIEKMAAKLSMIQVKSEPIKIGQIKEKFGSLRIYLDSYDEESNDLTYEIIRDAETESGKTCELCGNPGTIVSPRHWLVCLCETCLSITLVHNS